MMNPLDVLVLARTKMRTHKVRTGLTVGIAGILFGVIIAAAVVVQGYTDSINRFSRTGLSSRFILALQSSDIPGTDLYENAQNSKFIAEVETAYSDELKRVKTISAKYHVPFDASAYPSPVTIDPDTRKKVIQPDKYDDAAVQQVADEWRFANFKPFDVNDFMKQYSGYTMRGKFGPMVPQDGALNYMPAGKEQGADNQSDQKTDGRPSSVQPPSSLSVLDGSLAKPYVTNTKYDPKSGEIPVIIPFSEAQYLLKLDPLGTKATSQEQRDRLAYVIAHVGDIAVGFCYRNEASTSLHEQAVQQREYIKKYSKTKDYTKPDVVYSEPSQDCGATTIVSDTRTAEQKKYDANMKAYEQELGTDLGEPVQHEFTVRGVGVSGDSFGGGPEASGLQSLISSVFNAGLGYGTWSVPGDLYAKLPVDSQPDRVFTDKSGNSKASRVNTIMLHMQTTYLVEFDNKVDAKRVLDDVTRAGSHVWGIPFGSNALMLDELGAGFQKYILWALVFIGGVAVIILWGVIGRTVADSRRESAVFRAIGATRVDISSIYGAYVLLLSLRVVVFALVLGSVISVMADMYITQQATVAAQLAFAKIQPGLEFHIIGIPLLLLAIIIGTIVAASILASIIPILLGARRNPINDMRDE